MMKKTDTIINVSNLTIGYTSSKTTTVVADNINFSLQKGKLTALIGANGIGKSTLLKTLFAFEKPLSGAIYLNDKNISDYTQKQLSQKMSVVLTEKLPPSNLSVYELIALGRQPYTDWMGELSELDKNIIDQTIKEVGIENLSTKKYYELSDGQFQKVMIARALAQDTEIIILDEPTTHLDLPHKISVFDLLKKLVTQTQKCILFSTHDIELALDFCDEIIVMTPQQTIKDTPENIINNNVLDSLFDSQSVRFDKEKKKFVFKL
jgi:iron complex transport system ATP-binding protein